MPRRYDIIPILRRDRILATALKAPRKLYDVAFFLLKDYLSLVERGYDPLKDKRIFRSVLLSRIILSLQRAKAKVEVDPSNLNKTVDILLSNIARMERVELKKLAIYYSLCRYGGRLADLLNSARIPKCQT